MKEKSLALNALVTINEWWGMIMLNRLRRSGDTPDKLYKKMYAHIEKNYGKPNFSPETYARDEICKYLIKNPQECTRLYDLIANHANANEKFAHAKKMSAAYNKILIPEFMNALNAQGKLGKGSQANMLVQGLHNLHERNNPKQPAKQVDDPTPYNVMVVGDTKDMRDAIANKVQVEHGVKKQTVNVDNTVLTLNVMTEGDRFRNASANNPYKGLNGILLVYDATDKDSFTNLKTKLDEINIQSPGSAVVIVGINCDSPNRVVTKNEAHEFAANRDNPIPHVETGNNINNSHKVFSEIGKAMKEARQMNMNLRQTNRM